jgi:hypothetical protein
VDVDHCCVHIAILEEFLKSTDILAILQVMRGECVSQQVAPHGFDQASLIAASLMTLYKSIHPHDTAAPRTVDRRRPLALAMKDLA